MALLKHVSLVY